MKQINDEKRLNSYLEQYRIRSLFDTKGLVFRLYQYDKGEILNHVHDAADYLRFVVDGTVQIYSVRRDGSYYPIGLTEGLTLLGDMEFCGETSLPLVMEVVKKVICVELPLHEYRVALQGDTTFLKHLSRFIAHKLAMFVQSEAPFSGIEEKLLHYMKYDCPKGQFKGVEAVATHLRCSRRQLQRLLRSLTEQGKVEKIGKGSYRLAEG